MTEQVTITVDRDHAIQLALWLDLLEDWLSHTSEPVREDLARFGFRLCDPRDGIALLISDLGDTAHAVWQQLRPHNISTAKEATPMTINPAEQATTPEFVEADAQDECLCHDMIDCPDEATVTISAYDLSECSQLLTDLDEFLRSGGPAAELLGDYLAEHVRIRRDAPGMNAGLLIDTVSFTAASLRRQLAALDPAAGGARR